MQNSKQCRLRLAQITLAGLLMLCLTSCSPPSTELMPLRVGEQWGFIVQSARQSIVANIKVTREAAVGGVPGFELAGPSGISRMAWKNGQLIASELSGTRYSPPIVLCASDIPKKAISWQGTLSTPLHDYPASASNKLDLDQTSIGGQTFKAVRSVLVIQFQGSSEIELKTWYVKGMGIIRQEQRTNGQQVLSMERLSGS